MGCCNRHKLIEHTKKKLQTELDVTVVLNKIRDYNCLLQAMLTKDNKHFIKVAKSKVVTNKDLYE